MNSTLNYPTSVKSCHPEMREKIEGDSFRYLRSSLAFAGEDFEAILKNVLS